ncbi:response regulator [Nocardioides sp. zg-DK7169]|uniref:response regulator n=1 Tax=Nocardioides sp. zg-DK7169 TaxID=2736600 RepID=UPI001555E548|nr:response regulator [Nocardioides sp. zg-DK7169]NPC98943.1 response regulator [Nocardioides sp. zg-DK7169]
MGTSLPHRFESWVLHSLPDAVWVVDDDGRTAYADERLGELVSRAPSSLVGHPAAGLGDEAGLVVLTALLGDLAAGLDVPEEVACTLRGAGEPGKAGEPGDSVRVVLRPAPLLDEDGVRRGWLLTVAPARPAGTYEEVRRRELRLLEAQRVAEVGSWEWEVATGEVVWSDQLFRLMGLEPSALTPGVEVFLDLLDPEDRARVSDVLYAAAEGRVAPQFDARLPQPGRPPRWLRVRSMVLEERHGAPVRLGGTIQDVTESKEHENGAAFLSVLAPLANTSRTLLEALLAANDLVRPVAQWPAVLVGVPDTPEGAAGPEDLTWVDVTWVPQTEERARVARELAERVARERRVLSTVAGTRLLAGPVEVRGRLACVLVVDMRAAAEPRPYDAAIFEEILLAFTAVAERELSARELAAARDEALGASRAKSEFLATMSHEIRTPLNGVIGLSELLGRTELTTHQRRLAQGIDQAGRTLLSLVNDILDLSKIEAGRLDLEELDFDPRAVLEQSAALVAERAAEKGLELLVSSAAETPGLVRGDQVRFGQVVTNLVSNAVKFTAAGEVVVRATGTAGSATSGPCVRVEVRDTGIGITPEVRERLFEAFSQADSSTTREYGGTGLGLAISERIVTAMGGEIGVESEPGVGSTFWFEVGFEQPQGRSPGRDTARERAVAGLRVLVVDDNETNRFILTEQLQTWQAGVRAVDSAYAGLVELDAAAGRGAPYDLVLLDYMMPGADGEQVARMVRQEARHERVRLVLLSSGTEREEAWLRAAGIDAYLSKPVLPTRLLDVLARLGGRLEQGAGAGDRPAAGSSPAPVAAGARGRVLVVEDNEVNQLVAEGLLGRLGYEVRIVEHGAAAVAAVAADPGLYDAVLMDCQMPVMDGYDATRAIRAMPGRAGRLPIVAMTAAAVAEERDRCLAAGMDDFLAKPVDVGALEATLERWVAARPETAEAGPAAAEIAPAAPPASTGVAERLGSLLDSGIPAELVTRMADRFHQVAERALVGAREAVDAGDATAVAAAVHALRGSSGNLGLGDVAERCSGLEAAAREGRLPESGDLVALAQAVAVGVEELAAVVARLLPSRP